MVSGCRVLVSGDVAGRKHVRGIRMVVDPEHSTSIIAKGLARCAGLVEGVVTFDCHSFGQLVLRGLISRIAVVCLYGLDQPRIPEIVVPMPSSLMPRGVQLVLGRQFAANAGSGLWNLPNLEIMPGVWSWPFVLRALPIVAQCPSVQGEIRKK